jgi:DNA-binding PucR family transcriptional regulator
MAEVIADPMSLIAQQMDIVREDFVAEVFEQIKAENRDLNYDAQMLDLWRASLNDSVVAGIEFLGRGTSAEFLEAPEASVAYARSAARRDIPLSVLVRAHRIVHSRFLESAIRYVALVEPTEQVPTIVNLVSRSATFVDAVADQLTVAYELERDECVSSKEQFSDSRAGAPSSGTPERALGYPLDGVHLAAVLWVDAGVPAHDVVGLLDQVRSVIGAEVGAVHGTLIVPTDEREARLWFSVDASAKRDLDPSRVRRAFESEGIRARVAFGRVDEGQSGFRASLKQAERAKAVAFAGGERLSARVVFYSEVAPIALMAGDVDQLSGFVTEVLGHLGVDDERAARLREALREFLARNRTYTAADRSIILQPNTIPYPVAEAIQLSGQRFDDPDAVFKVQLALEVCRWMAPTVLAGAGRQR